MKRAWTAFSLVTGILSLLMFCAAVRAQTVQPGGACLQVTSMAAAGDISGVELEAGTKGANVTYVITDDSAEAYAFTISAASVFDQAVTVQASSMVFGQVTPTSTVRRGQDSAGIVVGDGHFVNLRTQPFDLGMFIPAGKFFTIRQRVVNTAAVVTFCFFEPR